MATKTKSQAEQELEIIKKKYPDSVLIPFEKEIIALCEAFGKSAQSGGSAPYTASIISKALQKLLQQKPISEIEADGYWLEPEEFLTGKDVTYRMNARCGALFLETKHLPSGDESRAYYLDAISWKETSEGEDDDFQFFGTVYYDDLHFKKVSSCQYVKFPFTPKTFYIDVVNVAIEIDEAIKKGIQYSHRDGKFYYTKIKDVTQLKPVMKYYDFQFEPK